VSAKQRRHETADDDDLIATYNAKTLLAVSIPITSQRKGYPFEVPLKGGGFR